jgi:hypothetical protein
LAPRSVYSAPSYTAVSRSATRISPLSHLFIFQHHVRRASLWTCAHASSDQRPAQDMRADVSPHSAPGNGRSFINRLRRLSSRIFDGLTVPLSNTPGIANAECYGPSFLRLLLLDYVWQLPHLDRRVLEQGLASTSSFVVDSMCLIENGSSGPLNSFRRTSHGSACHLGMVYPPAPISHV